MPQTRPLFRCLLIFVAAIGAFATSLSGRNSFSGLFTGPRAEELIGNFAFPYASPKDGATEQAAGAFVGRRN